MPNFSDYHLPSKYTVSPRQIGPFVLTVPQDKLAWDDPRSNRGYVKIGRERVTQSSDPAEIAELRKKAPDSKETMEIGYDLDNIWKNKWPQEGDAPGFKQTMLSFFEVLLRSFSHLELAILICLDLP